MAYLWDYDINELKKTEQGRIFILERQINYGFFSSDTKKIKLAKVKKYWDKLHLFTGPKRLFEFLIWGKITTSLESKSRFWPQ